MSKITRIYTTILALTFCTVAFAADEPLTMEGLREELNEVRDDANSLRDRLERSLQIHGFISQGWMRSTDNNWLTDTDDGSFDFNEMGLNVQTELTEDLHLGMQLFTRNLGDFDTDGIVIDFAYGDYALYDWLGFRIGRVKTAMGLYGESRDIDAVRVPVLLPQAVYDDKYRQFIVGANGMSTYGHLMLDPLGGLDYQAWIGGISINADSGLNKYFERNGLFVVRDLSFTRVEGAYANWESPIENLRFVGSFSRFHDLEVDQVTGPLFGAGAGLDAPASIKNLDMCIVGAEYTWGSLILAGEYSTIRGKMRTDLPAFLGGTNYFSIYTEGYYTSATYQFTSKLSASVYYGLTYEDASDKDGSNQAEDWYAWQKDLCFSTRYDVNDNWLIKAEVHFINGVDMLFPVDNPDGFEEDWRLFALKVTYSF